MTITIKIDTGNAAFEDDQDAEVARILSTLIDDWRAIRADGQGNLYDYNGNKVGSVKVSGR